MFPLGNSLAFVFERERNIYGVVISDIEKCFISDTDELIEKIVILLIFRSHFDARDELIEKIFIILIFPLISSIPLNFHFDPYISILSVYHD